MVVVRGAVAVEAFLFCGLARGRSRSGGDPANDRLHGLMVECVEVVDEKDIKKEREKRLARASVPFLLKTLQFSEKDFRRATRRRTIVEDL